MKKSFSGLGSRMTRILAGMAAAIGLTQGNTPFNAPKSNPIRSSGKSSGGRTKVRLFDHRHRAWKKLFGGLAVPEYRS